MKAGKFILKSGWGDWNSPTAGPPNSQVPPASLKLHQTLSKRQP